MRPLFFGLLAFCALGLGGCWGPQIESMSRNLAARAHTHYWEAVLGKDTIQIKYTSPIFYPNKSLIVVGNRTGLMDVQKDTEFFVYARESKNLDIASYSGNENWTSTYGDFSNQPFATTLVFDDICIFKPLLDAEGKAYADSLHAAKQDTSIKFIQKPYNLNYQLTSDEEKYLRKRYRRRGY